MNTIPIPEYFYQTYTCPIHGEYEYASLDGGHECPTCEEENKDDHHSQNPHLEERDEQTTL